jgi:serine/threonine protein kinase
MIRPGQRIGKYQVMGKLANGGMAAVYLARDLKDPDQLVVLKVILPHLRHNPDYHAMFAREAAVGALVRHPNAVEVYGLTTWEDCPILVMEFLDGRNLIQVIGAARRRRQAISFPVVAHLVARVARAMELAWNIPAEDGRSACIVHRDISPENVVLTYEGDVKLVDFGIAKHSHIVGNTLAGQLKGKYSYMSPEQIHGEPADHRADQYSLCVLLYILLTGRKPFVAANDVDLLRMIVGEDAVPPSQIDPTVPGVLEEIALRGLRKAAEARFTDHSHLASTIEDRYLAKSPASSGDIRTLMNELFPADSDAIRRRIQMLIAAEREATVTGIYTALPEPELDAELGDETFIEVAMPQAPTANFRATAIIANPLEEASEPSLEEATKLVAMDQRAAPKTPTPRGDKLPPRSRPVPQPAPPAPMRSSPSQILAKLQRRSVALTALAVAALLGAFLAQSRLTETPNPAQKESTLGMVAFRTTGTTETAEVRINGEQVGSTPFELKQTPGTISVLCSFKRRQVVRRIQVDVTAGERTHVLCEPGFADLRITGPRGYQISIDGKKPVNVPIRLIHTMEGNYDLIWSRPGRNTTIKRTLRLGADENRLIKHWNQVQ